MPLQIAAVSKLIQVTSPTTAVDAQALHDFVEDYMASPVGMANDSGDPSFFGDILKPEGKIQDPNNPTVYSQIILIMNSEWQIQFWPGSGYTRLFGGKIVGGVSNQPFKATGAAGDITVLESPVDGLTTVVETGVSGLTPQESALLASIADVDIRTAIMEQIMRNEAFTDPVNGDYVILSDDGQSELYRIPIWKNMAGTEPYDGTALNRRMRIE